MVSHSTSFLKHSCLVLLLLTLSACNHSPRPVAKVVDLSRWASSQPSYHARSGDTFASIAAHFNLTQLDLLIANQWTTIPIIVPGQKIDLIPHGDHVEPFDSHSVTSGETGLDKISMPIWQLPVAYHNNQCHKRWRFYQQGILWDTQSGDHVVAVMPGKIVYQGDGIRQLGHLIIIKHAQGWLSVYAHVDRYVKQEGNFVQSGEIIADMSSERCQSQFYFELRFHGKVIQKEAFKDLLSLKI